MRFLFKGIIHLLGNMFAIYIAARFIDGISLNLPSLLLDSVKIITIIALVFGIVSAIVQPIMRVLSTPIMIATFGLFILVINGALLWFSSVIVGDYLTVTGFVPAIIGALVISIIGWAVGLVSRVF